MRIEDYAIIGDTETAALVGRDGAIDWLCFPRFDSAACFAALLGTSDNGRWLMAPRGEVRRSSRRYRSDSLVLEHEVETDDGVVRIVDCMSIGGPSRGVVRVVEGVRGRVAMHTELRVRYDYGNVVPWVRRVDGRLHLVSGPNALVLDSPIELRGRELASVADFEVAAGERVPFVLSWYSSFLEVPAPIDAVEAIATTDAWWRVWVSRCTQGGPDRDAVVRSLITLKALTYTPSGGIVAAATTSLPEQLGGARNWDYRFCWLRDATFTLECMAKAGYRDEACAWRDWLLRAAAGDPAKLQILYGLGGEPRVEERTLDWLQGYEGSLPVRVGNAAVGQVQLDVYGETIDMLHQARRMGLPAQAAFWDFERSVMGWLEEHWHLPDEGLWEVRGARRQFTHSKVMAWVAFDRAVKSVERFGLEGPAERWRGIRDRIHADVCAQGFHPTVGAFTQAYGSEQLDASTLLIPIVGFLPPHDPRVIGTIAAIERDLMDDGFVLRYRTEDARNVDGLRGREGAFLACSFWLVDALVLAGRRADARVLFDRILAVRNDVGLLAEEYDPRACRLVGNFPQAFSHVGLVNSARNLADDEPAESRRNT
jgi:GH15 family glucan-1,4-alpha-glucosidase